MQALHKAEYDYTAQTDDELTIREDQLLFLLEAGGDDWYTVRIKTDNPGAETPKEGLVPATYVVPAPVLATVSAAYDYDAAPDEPEEVSMRENERLQLYEKGEDWSLVGSQNGVGFVPTAYLDDAQGESGGQAEPPAAPPAPPPAPAAPSGGGFLPPPQRTAAKQPPTASAVETFNASLAGSGGLMKSKKKGTLGIGNGTLFFASESDRTAVQQHALDELESYDKPDKHTVQVRFADGTEMGFEFKAKDDASKVLDILQGTGASHAGGEGQNEEEEEAAPPARATALPPPPKGLRMMSSSDEEEEEDDDDDDDARAAPPAPAPPPPPPPAPAAPPPPAAPAAPPPPSAAAPVAPSQPQKQSHVMAYDFQASESDEITVNEGDAVQVIDDSSEDWWTVIRIATGEQGNVPAQYVEASESAPPPAAAAAASVPPAAPQPPPVRFAPPPQRTRSVSSSQQQQQQQQQQQPTESPEGVDDERQAQIDSDALKAQRMHDAEQRRIMKEAEARDMRTARGIHFADDPPSKRGSSSKRDSDDGEYTPPRPIPVPQGPDDLNGPMPQQPPAESGRKTPSVPEVSKSERKKPNMEKTRIWKDRTGNFKVEAEFLGVHNHKVRLHKVNGVVIDVPVDKMAPEDVRLIKNLLKGRQPSEDDVPLARSKSSAGGSGAAAAEKEKEKRHRAKLAQQQQQQQKKKPTIDWFEFFLNAGCDLDDCTRYTTNFERDRIDEEVLPELEASTMRSLGLREGDVIRVRKHIKAKYGRSAAIPEDNAGAKHQAEDGDKEGPGLFTSPGGGLKSTRRGRPTPSKSGSSVVSSDGLKGASEELNRAVSPANGSAREGTTSPSPAPKEPAKGSRRSSSVQPIVGSASGFDDDAWTVKPSSKPSTPAPAPTASPEPPAKQPQPASPQPQKQSNADLAEDILNRMGVNNKSPAPAPGAPQQRQTSQFLSPSPQPPQPQMADPNAPRGPYAPVVQNAPMLNPLVPTQTGFNGFVPTRPQSTGMMPQSTGMPPMSMGPQPTGMMSPPSSMGMGMSMGMQPTGMMAQSAGMPMGMPGSMGMSGPQPQPTGYMPQQQPQPTGFAPQMSSYQQPQPQYQQPQMGMQPTGFQQPQPPQQPQQGLAPQPTGVFANPSMFGQQQQPQPTGSSPANRFEPGNVFAAMKSGAGNLDSTPKSSDSYNALRPQMTGMPGQQQQPLQPQPTGFAPMQMQLPMQTGMGGNMYGQY